MTANKDSRDEEPPARAPSGVEPSDVTGDDAADDTEATRAGDITLILRQVARGEAGAEGRLYDAVYTELRNLASSKAQREAQAVQPTTLVHDAYLRLCGSEGFESRRHFFGAAARAMAQTLIDRARRSGAQKRQAPDRGDLLDVRQPGGIRQLNDLLALRDALDALEQLDSRKAEVVRNRAYLGMTTAETAEILGVSLRTVEADWAFAKAWLRAEMLGSEQSGEEDPEAADGDNA